MTFSRNPLWLALCLALAGCQSTAESGHSAAARTAALQPWQAAEAVNAEAAQLLADDRFWPGANRLLAGRDGLALYDAAGRRLAHLPGRFGALDHRAGADGLLVALHDDDRQTAVLATLDGAHRWSAPLQLPRRDFKIEGLCLYRDTADNAFLFLVGEEGRGEQWLVGQGQRLVTPRRVRGLSLPPESEHCQVDDGRERLYVNETGVGLWAYEAHPEAPLVRQPVALRQPFGDLAEGAAGMAAVPGGVLLLDPEARTLHRYVEAAEGWRAEAPLALGELDDAERLSVRPRAEGLELLVVDDAGLHRGRLDWRPTPPTIAAPLPVVPVRVQTEPVESLGDAADDPAIWVHPSDPARSRVLGTDKQGGLVVYDLAGNLLQHLPVGRLNNVDVRSGVRLGERTVDLAVASNRDRNALHVFTLDRDSGEVAELGVAPTPLEEIYGLCLFQAHDGTLYALPNDKDGRYLQYRLDDRDGTLQASLVRQFQVASQPEGCVADDAGQRLFVGEERRGVWTLDARPEVAPKLEPVIEVGGPLHADVEGLAFYRGAQHSYLVVSSQGNDSYLVLDAAPPYRLRGAFRLGLNAEAGIDGASETDGLEVTSANLGAPWQRGLLVVQDGRKRMPETAQNFKYAAWDDIARALDLP
ncbi:phytase [Stutzerimonas azotifigens]|uniref:phytase n=1 Tax=Stutzerimonas azotifigens TaxID=291995 RepID=UPI0004206483|nr:phytase [Stutzerimonas azotifigens]